MVQRDCISRAEVERGCPPAAGGLRPPLEPETLGGLWSMRILRRLARGERSRYPWLGCAHQRHGQRGVREEFAREAAWGSTKRACLLARLCCVATGLGENAPGTTRVG